MIHSRSRARRAIYEATKAIEASHSRGPRRQLTAQRLTHMILKTLGTEVVAGRLVALDRDGQALPWHGLDIELAVALATDRRLPCILPRWSDAALGEVSEAVFRAWPKRVQRSVVASGYFLHFETIAMQPETLDQSPRDEQPAEPEPLPGPDDESDEEPEAEPESVPLTAEQIEALDLERME